MYSTWYLNAQTQSSKTSSIYITLTQLFTELKQREKREIDIAVVLLLLSERAWSQLMTTH